MAKKKVKSKRSQEHIIAKSNPNQMIEAPTRQESLKKRDMKFPAGVENQVTTRWKHDTKVSIDDGVRVVDLRGAEADTVQECRVPNPGGGTGAGKGRGVVRIDIQHQGRTAEKRAAGRRERSSRRR